MVIAVSQTHPFLDIAGPTRMITMTVTNAALPYLCRCIRPQPAGDNELSKVAPRREMSITRSKQLQYAHGHSP